MMDAWGWCTGMTQRDGTGREEDGRVQDGEHVWRIHVDVWQNQYNIVTLKKKKKNCLLRGEKEKSEGEIN